MHLLKTVFNISNEERRPVALSFSYYFCLMSAYFILRPVRDEMGIQGGIENLQWLFTGTFASALLLAPIFGFLTRKISRDKLIPGIYVFFSLNILAFYITFRTLEGQWLSMAFFMWLSVFSIFAISIFWGFNSDIFDSAQAKRLYGPIAAGGSAGAIVGPAVATILVGKIGVTSLLLVSLGFMVLATLFAFQMAKMSKGKVKFIPSLNTSAWHGLRMILKSPMLKQISLFILLYSSISTILYFEQAHIVSNAFPSSSDRTAFFGTRDLLINIITLILQFFLTEKIIRKWGIIFCLILVPSLSVLSFLSLSLSQSVYLLLGIQIAYRSLNFSVQRPTREILFTEATAEERYRSKNFMDTAVYRGGDAMSAWLFAGLFSVIGSLQIMALVTIPLAVTWVAVGLKTGRLFNRKTSTVYEIKNEIILTKKSA